MAVFVGAAGSAGFGPNSLDANDPFSVSVVAPGQPAFWSVIILALLVVAVVVIARGAM